MSIDQEWEKVDDWQYLATVVENAAVELSDYDAWPRDTDHLVDRALAALAELEQHLRGEADSLKDWLEDPDPMSTHPDV